MNNAPDKKPIACGRTAEQWVSLLQGDKQQDAKKALNYFDGQQKIEMEALLNHYDKGRKNWKSLGMIPRFRNLTRMVVEKSGMLFKDAAPDFSIVPQNEFEPDEKLTKLFAQETDKLEWHEFFINFDQIVRLLKTGILLVQYDLVEDKPVLDILHRGNANFVVDPTTRAIQGLIYRVCDDDDTTYYRIFTNEEIIDLSVEDDDTDKIQITGTVPNVLGFVPAAIFYDTTIPRNGLWVEASHDLVDFNELLNLHITDSEYVISHMKRPTMFTNHKFVDEDGDQQFEIGVVYGERLPRQLPTSGSIQMGPGKAVYMDSQGVDNPYIKYEAPTCDLKSMDQVVQSWIEGFAADWSVQIETSSSSKSRATSGFQLLVEEIDNLDLRKQRQRMFEQGFKRFYKIFRQVVNMAKGKEIFPLTTDLIVEFPDPFLPIDALEQENTWQAKIDGGRATEIDYFMSTMGVSEEEAEDIYMNKLIFEAKKPLLQQIAAAQAKIEASTEADKLGINIDLSPLAPADDPSRAAKSAPDDGSDEADRVLAENESAFDGASFQGAVRPGILE